MGGPSQEGDGIMPLEKEGERPELFLSAMWEHGEKVAICKAGRELSPEMEPASIWFLDFTASRNLRNKCLLP